MLKLAKENARKETQQSAFSQVDDTDCKIGNEGAVAIATALKENAASQMADLVLSHRNVVN